MFGGFKTIVIDFSKLIIKMLAGFKIETFKSTGNRKRGKFFHSRTADCRNHSPLRPWGRKLTEYGLASFAVKCPAIFC